MRPGRPSPDAGSICDCGLTAPMLRLYRALSGGGECACDPRPVRDACSANQHHQHETATAQRPRRHGRQGLRRCSLRRCRARRRGVGVNGGTVCRCAVHSSVGPRRCRHIVAPGPWRCRLVAASDEAAGARTPRSDSTHPGGARARPGVTSEGGVRRRRAAGVRGDAPGPWRCQRRGGRRPDATLRWHPPGGARARPGVTSEGGVRRWRAAGVRGDAPG
jgi:hypothetical protein